MKRLFTAVVAALATAVLTAPGARADDQSYLADLHAAGVFMTNENMWVINGHRMCDMIHSGIAPQTLYDQFGLQNFQGPQIVDIAQHDLCPDTLH
ncbi:DUF732 domain-containing protein [Mycobacterium intracellulare]|uniref:DUF732 domain-containing protein n=1 Tax=Mycobacterium intracellulare TaxID=1767 RepID=UPI00259667FE|nr:DUF732 domain-containing protein [Mycobacterium intracellulare]MDM3894728.1 DUF732 domain-containing protein [Mycobacterium intracellulare]